MALNPISISVSLPKGAWSVTSRTIISAFLILAASAALANSQPQACTQPAAAVHGTDATLHGMAVPKDGPTQAWFEWGHRGTYDQTTPPLSIGPGNQVVHVSSHIEGLIKGGVYQQRLVVSNSNLVVRGATMIFTTGRRAVTWGPLGGLPYTDEMVTRSFDVVAVASGGLGFGLQNDGTIIYLSQTPIPWGPTNVSAFAAGQAHLVELHPDGTVTASGDNTYGQTNVPPGLTSIVAVAAGSSHSLALKDDGTVVGWGLDLAGETTSPPDLSNVVALACGAYFSSALRADGTVISWGLNTLGQTNMPAGLTNVVAISCGATHTVALKEDGTVLSWGSNAIGQTNVPPTLSNVVAVSAGGNCCLALMSNAYVSGWGKTNCGGFNIIGSFRDAAAIAAGDCRTLTLCSNEPPVAYPQEGSSPPGSDQVVQLSGWDQDNDELSFRIASLPGRGTLFQCVNGARGGLISTAEPVTDFLHRVVFAPGSPDLSTPYTTFSFVVNDGETDSPPGTVTVNVLIPDPPRFDLADCHMIWTTNGTVAAAIFNLRFTGTSNATYRVWASTNLLDWNLLGNAISLGGGDFIFIDYPVIEKRFYRAAAP
jgi:hypothetical protein